MSLKKIFTVLISISLFLGLAGVSVLAEDSSLFKKVGRTVDALMLIRDGINNRYQAYLNVESDIIEATEKLAPIELKINTLKEQLKTLDENIRRAEINFSIVEQGTKSTQLELADLYELSEMREIELAHSQELLEEFVRLAYAETMRYTDWKTGEISTLKFLFSGESLADVEIQQTYLSVLQNTSVILIQDLQQKKERYDNVYSELLVKRGELLILQEKIISQKDHLAELKDAKRRLLTETRGEERVYQNIIEKNRQQQAEVLLEIIDYKEQLGVIDSKLKVLKDDLGEDEFRELLKKQAASGLSGLAFTGKLPRLAWPADPGKGITAYYMDSSYEGIFGVPHHAIDFRLTQGSRVSAAAPGIIYKTKDNGFGYSHIMIAHTGGLATVYGHISQIMVEEGDLVKAGDTIGLSGGLPGTRGAGYMTTGPHLHFEVIENGEHGDPLDYLPLEQLRRGDVPERYRE